MSTLVLDATTKTITAVMSGAAATNNPDFTAAWADSTSASLTEGASDGALNGTSSVTLVAAPASSTRRVIKWITIQNKDTAPVTVTINYDNNGTVRQIAKVTLAPNDTWTLDGTFSSSGSIKTGAGVSGPASSTDNAIARFDGTSGSAIQNSVVTIADTTGDIAGAGSITSTSASGILTRAAATQDGVIIAGRAGGTSSYAITLTPATLSASRTLTLPDPGSNETLGYLNTPINSQSTDYTLVLGDSGRTILHPSTDANARTFTIPANGSVAYPTGTVVTFINMTSNVVTIAITTDTMYSAGTGATGSRSLAQYGIATAVKMTSTTWLISGNGLT